MNNTMHINFDDESNSTWRNSSTDVDKIIVDVMQVAKNIHFELKPGLPKCVYQLALYNDLLKKGFQLQTEISVLNRAVKQEITREVIIANGLLIIECVVESEIHDHYYKTVKFYLENNGYTKALLINFSNEMQSNMITNTNHNVIIH